MTLRSSAFASLPLLLVLGIAGCPAPETETNPTTTTTTTTTTSDPAALDPPPSGKGFQIDVPEIQVAQGDEIQNCYFYKVSDLAKAGGLDAAKPVNLNHIEIAQETGSHHMNVFRVRTIVGLDPTKGTVEGKNGAGECFKSPNWADWPLVANSQEAGHVDWQFPDGVANVLQPDEWLMVQTHWVNATSQQTPENGKVRINFWNLDAADVKYEMGTIFATKQSVRVCQSNPTPEYSGSCQINSPEPVKIIGANGHFHSRGKEFSIYTWDGQSIDTPADSDRFYKSDSWNEPPMLHSPELDTTVPANGGVFYTCSYQWQQPDPAVGCKGLDDFDAMKYMTPAENLDCCYTFGPIVEKNEHCNIFIYYYPKQDDVNCF
ncbi:MAG: hypothetical protein U0441_32160 [Polyangiaceae bacterium]